MPQIVIILVIIAFVAWNTMLPGFHDRHTQPLESDDSLAFCEEAKSIVLTEGPNDTAIILVHGFPSTPATYRYSAPRFHEAGFDVYAPLLPGFGTDVHQFTKTSFTQWFSYLCRYYEDIRGRYRTVFVLGTSMGGMMTLKIGERYCSTEKAPDALVTLAAPVVYNSIKDGIITNPTMLVGRTLGLFTASIGAHTVQGKSGIDDGSKEWTGYGGLFVRQGLSLVKAMKPVRRNLDKITCPLFSIQDKNDGTVPSKNLAIIAKENGSKDFHMLETDMGPTYKHTHHVLLMYYSIREELTDTIIDFLKEKENQDNG